MAIKVQYEDWKKEEFKESVLEVAEIIKEEIIIEMSKQKFYQYNVQIWKNDDILSEKDFVCKASAKKWIKETLSKNKFKDAVADLKKYNKSDDDFDWWFFRMKDNHLIEVSSPEEDI